ncbi:MAG: hypothetical protein JWP34_5223, partial [Massilia sp.]|nr:hypothetical protein [Massilia sp.]
LEGQLALLLVGLVLAPSPVFTTLFDRDVSIVRLCGGGVILRCDGN